MLKGALRFYFFSYLSQKKKKKLTICRLLFQTKYSNK
jgi:hypothetical protein